MRLLLLIVVAWLSVSPPASGEGDIALRRIDGTRGLQINAGFMFTISPDDQWLVFFIFNESEVERPSVHDTYGLLRILNLRTGKLYALTVRQDEAPQLIERADASWSADSSLCVLPPPPSSERRIMVKFENGKEPTVLSTLEPPRTQRAADSAPEVITLPEHFTCSDCSQRSVSEDMALMKEIIPAKYARNLTPDQTFQAVSHDGSKVYYQEGANGQPFGTPGNLETSLCEIDVKTGTHRRLITHKGADAMIEQIRPSPDGRKIAYQLKFGSGFVSTPEIFVMDLASGKSESLAYGGGSMHWNSRSDELYFYRKLDQPERGSGNFLFVAELKRGSKPPAQEIVPAPSGPTTRLNER